MDLHLPISPPRTTVVQTPSLPALLPKKQQIIEVCKGTAVQQSRGTEVSAGPIRSLTSAIPLKGELWEWKRLPPSSLSLVQKIKLKRRKMQVSLP